MKKAIITAHGNVQCVGFRYSTRRIASKFVVNGWVRNERDGSVRIEVEGQEAELDRFASAIKTSQLGSGIAKWEETRGPCTGLSTGFDVAY